MGDGPGRIPPVMATLHGLSYSPWTERARWALDHHRVDYRYREHAPLLGELRLRRLARRTGRAKATVPLFVDGGRAIGDSVEIIRHADRVGKGAPLGADSDEVSALAARVDAALDQVRIRVTHRTLNDREALREAAATAVPEAVAGLLRPLAAVGARHIARKYGFATGEHALDESTVAEVLREIRETLGDGPFLGDCFSALDMLAASLLQGVRPAEAHGPALRPATRRIWTSAPLAVEFEGLLEWRDRLLARHR
jgi:glutathione S-transferase